MKFTARDCMCNYMVLTDEYDDEEVKAGEHLKNIRHDFDVLTNYTKPILVWDACNRLVATIY